MKKRVWAEALMQMGMTYKNKLRCKFCSVCVDGSEINKQQLTEIKNASYNFECPKMIEDNKTGFEKQNLVFELSLQGNNA